MTLSLISNKKKILLIGLISYYVIICLFSFAGHDHGPDLDFHDTCPACQWDNQSQEDFSVINHVLDALQDVLTCNEIKQIPIFIDLPKQDYTFTTLSRAPPKTFNPS